jgi:hypothetical protein
MPDLVDKFFQRDLSEAEQASLSAALLSSDETALKFETKAEKAYLSFGLPIPQAHWPAQDNLPWHSTQSHSVGHGWGALRHLGHLGHLGHWIWPSVFVAGVAGSVATWHYTQKMTVPVAAAEVSTLSVPTPFSRSPVLKPVPQPALKAVVPVRVDETNPPVFSSLSVVVHRAQSGPVQVRVTDPSGQQIIVLYNGDLQPGSWAFQWDGKLNDGDPAKPGFYWIEVQAGAFQQRKSIQIQ